MGLFKRRRRPREVGELFPPKWEVAVFPDTHVAVQRREDDRDLTITFSELGWGYVVWRDNHIVASGTEADKQEALRQGIKVVDEDA